jgi:hypothetical protein
VDGLLADYRGDHNRRGVEKTFLAGGSGGTRTASYQSLRAATALWTDAKIDLAIPKVN